ncbi:hypothetical protein EV663_1027 [Rhodovulum bhavnagarense]|uniref:Uncharacterized protein n=1 Tax=Rhodovulum bhavnagarense TaxID=992286 RepID=A0A4R2RSP3_9RHOB|nr:hypothetical protein [Rhodovulum bhavnagarense]TCP62165.1 hypothetical protein EV663_1027 [Rhodovulum bhavnagarense]
MTITRRATLAALTASPLTIASVATQAAPGGEGQTTLEKTYVEWLSALNDIEETLILHPADKLTKVDENRILGPLYDRADTLQEAMIAAPVTGPRDLAVKVLVVLATPGALDDDAVDRIKADAMRLVNLTDAKTT